MDQQLKQLMKELGDAINESLADTTRLPKSSHGSKKVATIFSWFLRPQSGLASRRKVHGQDFLSHHADSNPELKVSDQDLKFLKSLRIKVEDDAA